MSAPAIRCRYADLPGRAAACGAFDTEHHARAAEAGLCCATLAFTGTDQDDLDVSAPVDPDWPPFARSDDDVPGVTW